MVLFVLVCLYLILTCDRVVCNIYNIISLYYVSLFSNLTVKVQLSSFTIKFFVSTKLLIID